MPQPPPDYRGLGRLLAADSALSARLAISSRLTRVLALSLAHSGDGAIWLAGAVGALLWGGPRWRPFGLRVLVATLGGAAVATLLKWLFRRSRPGKSTGGLYSSTLDRHAFPSGHATRAGCVVVVLAPIVPGWAAGLLAAWAVLVSLARVALQVHYVLDVLVGLAVGGVMGLALLAIL